MLLLIKPEVELSKNDFPPPSPICFSHTVVLILPFDTTHTELALEIAEKFTFSRWNYFHCFDFNEQKDDKSIAPQLYLVTMIIQAEVYRYMRVGWPSVRF